MKQLLLVRHGIAEARDKNKKDVSRCLTFEGKVYIGKIASLLLKKSLKPDLILSSPAVRCKETAMIIHKVLSSQEEIKEDNRIYKGNGQDLVNTIKEVPDTYNLIILVGHNPALSELAHYVAEKFAKSMSKGSVLFFDLKIDSWADLEKESGFLKYYLYPARKKSQKYKKLVKSVEGVLFEHLTGTLDIDEEKEVEALKKPIKKYSRKLVQNLEKYL